ncbi:Protein of unknown function [Pyronema omphalodes CBS 100304]|uniref:Uncharacterized protein n=1 Tax=Pyronema omphalodes (strain CBS 100304) TaxID=1076935 RepID=U4LVP9_PYROM|nr:Protein of unknown function [Pyronema omphalodes CBS 100304]
MIVELECVWRLASDNVLHPAKKMPWNRFINPGAVATVIGGLAAIWNDCDGHKKTQKSVIDQVDRLDVKIDKINDKVDTQTKMIFQSMQEPEGD